MNRAPTAPEAGQRRRARSLASAVALVAIVFVVPIILVGIGGMPLDHLGYREVSQAVAHSGSYDSRMAAHWLARGAILVAWFSWMWMTACVALELRTRVTGGAAPHLPASRTMQSIAACLVGTALAMSVASRQVPDTRWQARVATVQTSTALPALKVLEDALPRGTAGSGRAGPDPQSGSATELDEAPPKAPPTATHAPPHPPRSPEGPPGAGGVQPSTRESDPTQARPEALPRTGEDGHAGTVGNRYLVSSRETLWSIATDTLGSSLRWKDLARLNYGVRQADGLSLTSDHWILPGWTLTLPGADGRNGEPGAGPVRGLSSDVDPNGRMLDQGFSHAPEHPLPRPPVPVVPVGAGVVGAGVVNVLERMRRVQQRHRRGGTFIRLPDGGQRAFEQRLRIGDGGAVAHEVAFSLESLSRLWGHSASGVPEVCGVRILPEVIELLIDRPSPPHDLPEPFRIDETRRTVSVDRDGLSRLMDDQSDNGCWSASVDGRTDRRSPVPTLVTAGHGADGVVMVNLESLGSLLVYGDTAGCEGVMRALALELSTSWWSGQFDLFLVGFGAELERFDRVTAVSDVPALLRQLVHRRLRVEELLLRTGNRSVAQARADEPSDRWDPVVVICGPSTPEDEVFELLDTAAEPRLGSAVVAIGDHSGASHAVRLSGSDLRSSLGLVGSVVFPQQIEAEDLDGVTSLLDSAITHEAVLSSDEPYVHLAVPLPSVMAPAESETAGRGGAIPAHSTPAAAPVPRDDERRILVEVAVLGPLEISGASRSFTRAWARELVVYLALHPGGASNDAWATALWPDRLMAPSSLHSTASVARRALGQTPDGLDHLPRSHGRLALADTVGTDWDRFVALADGDTMEEWRALELVRGRPFEDVRASDWPILEGIAPAIEAAVVDVATRLADAYLTAEQPRGAEWAARQGLRVSPYDERLYRILMRAADLDGNPAGVESVMGELVRVVSDDIEPLESVHPKTMDLYRSLTRRRERSAGGNAERQHPAAWSSATAPTRP